MQRSNFFWLFLVVVSFLLACVVMRWPTFEVRSWIPPKIPAPVGVWKVNQLMVSSEMIGSDKMVAPEDIAVDTKGRVYSGCVDGTIWRVDRSGKSEGFQRNLNLTGEVVSGEKEAGKHIENCRKPFQEIEVDLVSVRIHSLF